MKELLKEVFVDQLYQDIAELKQNVPQVQTDFLISNLLVATSLLINNRISIQPNNHPKSDLNLYVLNVGHSGIGKSISSKPFINALGMLQRQEREQSLIDKEFCETCKAVERDSNEPLTPEQKEIRATELILSNPKYVEAGFGSWRTTYTPGPEFYITNFTPEALTKINYSCNKTGFIYADEYDKLINSVTRTKTVNDPCQFFTSLFDGEQISIIRKNSESESIDISLSLLINTTTANFKDSVNKNGFFHNGFGARLLYTYNSNEYHRTDLVPSSGTTFEDFSSKMHRLLDFLYDKYYKQDVEINYVIHEDLFHVINLAEKNIEETLDNSELPENIITTYKTRIRVMLLKLIALTEVINYTYLNEKEIIMSEMKVTEEMINRGSKLLNFFVQNFIELFAPKKTLKPEQEALLAQLTKGKAYAKDYLLTLTNMSESTLRRFLDARSDLFSSETIDRKKIYTIL